jgi:transketolase
MVAAYSKALVAQASRNDRIVALDGDLVLDTGLIPFRDRFPDRFIECGIAEQDMVSQAGAMALHGLLPVVHSFASFLCARPVEQIYNNASERTKVIYVGSLAGVVPAGPGHSHQAVNDISVLGAIPGLEIVEPSCEAEVAPLFDCVLNSDRGSAYVRLVSVPCEIPYSLPEDYRCRRGVGVELRPGKDAVVIGYGPVLLPQAWRAAEILSGKGVEIAIVNLPWLSSVDTDWLQKIAARGCPLFLLDNHLKAGGQGRMLAAAIAEMGLNKAPTVRRFGLTDFPVCGQNDEALRAHGLDADSLARSIAETLRVSPSRS